jgi:tetratricopeptide (TPR) repeat protein
MPKATASKSATTRTAAKRRPPPGGRVVAKKSARRVPRAVAAPRTLEDWEREGAQAFRRGAFAAAAAAYATILERLAAAGPPDDAEGARLQGEIEVRQAAALRRAGKLVEAKRIAERSIATAPDSPDVHAAAHIVLSELHLLAGNRPLAKLSADVAAAAAAGVDGPVSAWALAAQGRLLWSQQFHEDASQAFMQAYNLCRRHADFANAAIAAGSVGMCLMEVGRLPDARNWVGRAAEEAREAAIPAVEAAWTVGLARVALAEGATDEAANLAEAGLAIAQPLGLHLTVFRAEWLRHYLVTLAEPGVVDRARMAVLRKLKPALADYTGDREVQDLLATLAPKGRPAERVASFTEGCDPVPFPAG